MGIWLVMLCGGLITFVFRFSIIYLFGRLRISDTMRRALNYVPPAVLSAIIFPELFIRNGAMDLSAGNTRMLAGLVAVLVAWFGKNTLLTIVVGMAAFFVVRYLGL
jgi:branched-subunit amino acid transport protein